MDFQALIDALEAPECYPDPVERVTRLQTHVSCVFLAGAYAYKVKKPVHFPFIDYGTLEKRRDSCTKELRLNRQMCPGIYLDVVPISMESGRLRVDGRGEAVEWALRMRQMRGTEMLEERLRAGKTDHHEIGRIARHIARFHEGAERAPRGRYSTPAQIAETVQMACAVMDSVARERLPDSFRQVMRAYLTGFTNDHADLFLGRIDDGWIRDCHGDLRIQNICLDERFGNGIQVFDAIEFSDDLRIIDVAADIAYLAMDLDLAGRSDLRESMLHAYRHITGGDGLNDVLRFYQTYRAVIRANIAQLAANEPEIDEADRAVHNSIAMRAYDLARSYALRRERPALLIMAGYSGSGKTTLANELARRLPAVVISSDEVRRHLAREVGWDAQSGSRYAPARKAAVYDAMRRIAAKCLAGSSHVILDATFLSPSERIAAAELAQYAGAEFWMVECATADPLVRQRLAARLPGLQASDADLRVYEDQRRTPESITMPANATGTPGGHLVVDTAQGAIVCARDVLDRFAALDEQAA